MSEFNIQIKVDPSAAPVTIQQLRGQLADLEQAGPKAGAGITKGLNDAEKGATTLKEQLMQMANAGSAFSGLTQALDRERDMLEKIQKPLKELHEGHQALDSLMRQGKITAEQYTAQLEKLEQAAGRAPKEGGLSGRLEGGLDLGKTLLAGGLGGGIAGGVMEVGEQLEGIIDQSRKIKDAYIEMTNASLRFADATHTTDDVIAEQSDLSEELHSTFKPTIDLYARVREGSDALGLSHEQTIRLTKTLGEQVQLANMPLEAASGLMSKFAFAMEGGTMDARGLTQIMRQVPGILDIWTEKFHTTGAGIVQEFKSGRISIDDLVNALIASGEQSDKAFAGHKATNAVLEEEYMERVKTTMAQKDQNAMEVVLNEQLDRGAGLTHTAADAWRAFTAEIGKANESTKAHSREALRDLLDITHGLTIATGEFTTTLSDYARRIGIIKDSWDTELSAKEKVIKAEMEHASKVGEAKQQLAVLKQELQDGAISWQAYKAGVDAATTTIEGGVSAARKMLESIRGPQRDYLLDTAALEALLKRGAITWDEYSRAIQKVTNAYGPAKDAQQRLSEVEELGRGQAIARRQIGFVEGVTTGGESFLNSGLTAPDSLSSPSTYTKPEPASPEQTELAAMYDKTRTAAEKYADEIERVGRLVAEANAPESAKARILEDLAIRYGKVYTPAEEYAKAVKDLQDRMSVGLVSAASYEEKLDELKAKYGQGDIFVGMRDGVRALAKDLGNTATEMQSLMKSAVDGINKNISEMVVKGKADFGSLAQSIEQQLVEMALKKAEAGLFSSIAGSFGGGGAIAGAALGGGATGGDFDIPHAASGFAGVVRQRSGGDSMLAAFHVNPGEHVAIRTPQQQAAAQQPMAMPTPQLHVHNHINPSRELKTSFESGEMDVHVMNVISRNRGALRGYLGK